MNIPVSIELLAGILGGLIVSMVVLLLLQVRNSAMVNRIAAPAYEYVHHQAEVESQVIIDEAKQKAEAIIASAEAERAQILASYTEHAAELQASYQAHLKHHTEMLTQKMNGAVATHLQSLEGLGSQSIETVEQGRAKLEQRFNIFLESFTATEHQLATAATTAATHMTDKLTAATELISAGLENQDALIKAHFEQHTKDALEALDEELTAYKLSRMRILDTHIMEIVEVVTKRVLLKQLTITEHAELARDALEAAKKESFL